MSAAAAAPKTTSCQSLSARKVGKKGVLGRRKREAKLLLSEANKQCQSAIFVH